MKLILLIVSLIAVFTADCRNFPDGPTNQVSTFEANRFTDEIQYISFEPENPDSTKGPQNRYNKEPAPPGVVDVYEQNEIALRGKGGKKNLKTLIRKLEYLENNLTQANLKIETELQSLRENQNNISETDTQLKVLLLTKMENITDGDLQLKMGLQYIKDQQNNITNADIELKMELNSIMENITNGDMQLKIKLQSIIDYQINITDTDTNLKIELQSLMANITDSNSLLKTDVNSMKNNLNSYNSNIVSKLDSIISKLNSTEQGTGRLEHFPYASNKKTWADAKAYCESIGGQIWTPIDRNETIAVFKICGTLCWNGWHKNSGGVWVTGTGVVRNSSFWGSASEPGSSDDAAWSDSNGLWGRVKDNLYGWTCQM